jgi:hypothetical protein
MGVEQLSMNTPNLRGCVKSVMLLEALRLHKQCITHDHKSFYTFFW